MCCFITWAVSPMKAVEEAELVEDKPIRGRNIYRTSPKKRNISSNQTDTEKTSKTFRVERQWKKSPIRCRPLMSMVRTSPGQSRTKKNSILTVKPKFSDSNDSREKCIFEKFVEAWANRQSLFEAYWLKTYSYILQTYCTAVKKDQV